MSDLIRRKDAIEAVWTSATREGATKNIEVIPTADNSISLLPNGELFIDTEYADQTKSVRLMNLEGFTRVFAEPKMEE